MTIAAPTEVDDAEFLLEDSISVLSEACAIFDADQRLLACNDAYRDCHKPIADKILPGVPWVDLIRESAARGEIPEAAGWEGTWISRVLARDYEAIRDVEVLHADNSIWRVSIYPTRAGGFIVTRADITEQRRAEESLEESESLLGDAIEALAEGIAVYNADHRLVRFNNRYKDMFPAIAEHIKPGARWTDLLKKGVEAGHYADALDNPEAWLAGRVERGVPFDETLEIAMTSGKIYQIRFNPTRLGGFVVSNFDITERRQAEESLRQSEILHRDAMESLEEGIAIFDADHRLVRFNGRYAEMDSAIREVLKPGIHWADLMRARVEAGQYPEAEPDRETWLARRLEEGIQLGGTIEAELTDGRIYLSRFDATGLGGFVLSCVDVSEQRRAEAVLKTVVDTSSVALVMARVSDGKILFRSPAAEAMFGAATHTPQYFKDPEDRQRNLEQLKKTGAVDNARFTLIDANGREFEATASTRLTEYQGEQVVVSSNIDITEQLARQAVIRQVLEACPAPIQMTKAESGEVLYMSDETEALFGRVDSSRSFYVEPGSREAYLKELRREGWINEYKVQLFNRDHEPFWASVSARLIRFDGEEVIVSHTRDMTEQLAVEEELATQRELIFQNEKMSALGGLLAGVAHELNNPLSVVVGHALMLQDEARDPEIKRQTEKISSAAERCARIVKTFLSMARQQPSRTDNTDLRELVQTAVEIVSYSEVGNDLQIVAGDLSGLPEVKVDADQITQVLINLILNSAQAIETQGVGGRINVDVQAPDGADTVEISVTDDGPGIPPKVRPRIFEPFFTTKDIGEGTGIGLAFCHRIVRGHDGQIWADPEIEKGARICLTLPIGKNGQAEEAEQTRENEQQPGGAQILIVDDEADVAELTAEILNRAGYQTVVEVDATRAIARLQEQRFDAILSDLNMPGMDGRGFFETLSALNPELASVTGFITGDTMGASSQRFLREAKRPYLEKPVAPVELRDFVANILNSQGSG